MNKILKLFFVFLFFHSTVFSTDYWQPYPIHAEVITYNNIDRKVKFSVYDSLSGIWRYFSTPYYNTPQITLSDTMNVIIGFTTFKYNSSGNLVRDEFFGFVIFDQEIHQFKPVYDSFESDPSIDGLSMDVSGATMNVRAFRNLGGAYLKHDYCMIYSIIKNKWDTIILSHGVLQISSGNCFYTAYINAGFTYRCQWNNSSDRNIFVQHFDPVNQNVVSWGNNTFVGAYTTSGLDMTFSSNNGVYDIDGGFHGYSPKTNTSAGYYGGHPFSSHQIRHGIIQANHYNGTNAANYTGIYDDSLDQMKIDSTLISTATGVIIKDGIVTFKNGNSVWYKAFSPTTRTWVVGNTASSGIDSLKIVNGTVKWKNTAGTNFKAGYIDSLGWGNYDTPLLLSFYATEKFTSTGMPYVYVRNYSIGTDSICYDFGDGVISDYNQHSLWHLYKVNGHYQSAYPSVNYNICIKTVNDSGPQSSCQSYAITCVDATAPVITTTPTIICSNDSVILNLTGSLNTATKWAWYEGSCGNGAAVDTGSTITVKPLVTTTYFVRG